MNRDKYLIPVALKTLDVLEAFHGADDILTLEQVIARTAVPHTTAFRILHTLVTRGYLRVTGPGKQYRLCQTRKRARLGFATLTHQTSFANMMTESLRQAAEKAGVDLILYNNDRKPDTAIENARAMVASGVDIAIEFQRNEDVAPVIADIFAGAKTPAIAVLIPQPGATYFGVNNYRAGITAGHALAEHATTHWRGQIDLMILLDLLAGGPVLQSRMTGVLRGFEEKLGALPAHKVARLDGKGLPAETATVIAGILNANPSARRIVLSAVNDESALAALQVLREAGRADQCAIVGHGGSSEVWPHIRDPQSPVIGTTYFFPQRYGEGLVHLSLKLLRGEPAPPFHYMPHELIHRGNIGGYTLE